MARFTGATLVVAAALLLIAINTWGGLGPVEWLVLATWVGAVGLTPFVLGLVVQIARPATVPLWFTVLIGVLVTAVRHINPYTSLQLTTNIWQSSSVANAVYIAALSAAFAELGSAVVRLIRARHIRTSELADMREA